MKKLLAFIMCLVFAVSLTSCSSNSKLTVTFDDGTVEQLSAKEIVELSENNGRRFAEIDVITGEGTVTDSKGRKDQGSSSYGGPADFWSWGTVIDDDIVVDFYYCEDDLDLDDGVVPEEYKFYNGDKVEFSGYFMEIDEIFGEIIISVHIDREDQYFRLK